MQQEFLPSPGLSEMLGDALDRTPALAAQIRSAVTPLVAQREFLRSTLRDAGALRSLPDDGSYLSLTAVDGACTVSPLFIGDQVNVLAASVASDLRTGAVEIMGQRSLSEFLPHSPTSETYAKAAMLSGELALVATSGREDALVVLDGSHSTALTAVLEALAAEGSAAQDYICSDVISDEIIRAAQRVAEDGSVVACPKSDSSTQVCEFIERHGVDVPLHFPDKVMASLLLQPGEVLALETSSAPWEAYDLISHQVQSPRARAVLAQLEGPVTLLRENLRVAHIKPHGASTAVRVETKAALDDFATLDCWQAIADDCEPPHVQEPVAQYIADLVVKEVSVLSKVQLDEAQLDLAEGGDAELLEFLVRSYRTT